MLIDTGLAALTVKVDPAPISNCGEAMPDVPIFIFRDAVDVNIIFELLIIRNLPIFSAVVKSRLTEAFA
jgi:hypothetical protein